MNLEQFQDEEYECQYYGFTAKDFVKDFKELVLSSIKEPIDDLERNLVNGKDERWTKTMHEEFNNLYDTYKRKTSAIMIRVQNDIKRYFAIPRHVLLPDDVDNVPCSKSDTEKLENEVQELEQEYVKKRALIYLCEKELEILNNLDCLQSKVDQLVKSIKKHKETKDDEELNAYLIAHNQTCKKLSLLECEYKYLVSKDKVSDNK